MRKFIKYTSRFILGILPILLGAVLTLSGLLPLLAIIIFQMKWLDFQEYGLYLIIFALYGCGYIYAFVKMLRRYHLPFDYAFDLCVEDLQWLAKKWHTTYVIVNLLIFVVFFLILLVLNFYISIGLIPVF